MAQVIEGIPITTQPPRAGVRIVAPSPTANDVTKTKIADITHPDYNAKYDDWVLWRLTYKGGQEFIDAYLEKFSSREDRERFNLRKKVTPIPAFAKAAINDVKNAVFQRTNDITRKGGTSTYQQACSGQLNGVDLSGGTMNWFLGNKIIGELLTIGKIGVFTDMPVLKGKTQADKGDKHPYYYTYKAEDIRSWSYKTNGEFQSVLLRSHAEAVDKATGLPIGLVVEYRLFSINEDGYVDYKIYNADSKEVDQGTLLITEIPFTAFEISDSLLADVARHQIALLNLESSDIAYALLANYPFYIEQVDTLAQGSHLKKAQSTTIDGTVITEEKAIETGTTNGRQYGKDLDAPTFIHPSTEPLEASMEKQDRLKADIRQLINLSLSSIQPKMASAESKELDQHGLESGLSYIGLELEHGERKLAKIWAKYEGSKETATITYPKRYSLKSDSERQDEAVKLAGQLGKVPSITYQRTILKEIATILVGDKVSTETLDLIIKEIDNAQVLISDPETLITMIEAGIISKALTEKALYLPEGTMIVADKEHAERLKRIAISQTIGEAGNLKKPAERGVKDLAE